MKTRVIKINPNNIDDSFIDEAALVIRKGGLVAFPTETVYGLGANALDPSAVKKIFKVKKRPLDDPLIVHVAKMEDIKEITSSIPDKAREVMRSFWPGPLTIILRKSAKIPKIVTSSLDTVAVRMPSNIIAKRLIEKSGVPIAAPSANMFGHVSPTSADHVLADLDGKVDLVIDGGKTDIGIESTVIEFIGENSCFVHRPGGTTVEQLGEIIKKVALFKKKKGEINKSPGKYVKHYAPKASVIIIDEDYNQVNKASRMAASLSHKGQKVGIMAKPGHSALYGKFYHKVVGRSRGLKSYAAELYKTLREFEAEGFDIIIAEGVKEKDLGRAIMDRLRKASGL